MKTSGAGSIRRSEISFGRLLVMASASMSVIPLLTLVYFMVVFVEPHEKIPGNIALIVGLNAVLAIGGVLMLARTVRAVRTLRRRLEKPDGQRIPFDTAVGSSELSWITNATEAMGSELGMTRGWLNEMSLAMEQASRERTTDRQRHEREVGTIMEACPLAMMTIDAEGTITRANGLAGAFMGVSAGELRGNPYHSGKWQFRDCDGGVLTGDALPVSLARDKGSAVQGLKSCIVRSDGITMAVLVDVVPIFDESAAFQGAIITLDNTDGDEFTSHLPLRLSI